MSRASVRASDLDRALQEYTFFVIVSFHHSSSARFSSYSWMRNIAMSRVKKHRYRSEI